MSVIARILTIEDDPAVRNGIVAYLEDSGFEMLEGSLDVGHGESDVVKALTPIAS